MLHWFKYYGPKCLHRTGQSETVRETTEKMGFRRKKKLSRIQTQVGTISAKVQHSRLRVQQKCFLLLTFLMCDILQNNLWLFNLILLYQFLTLPHIKTIPIGGSKSSLNQSESLSSVCLHTLVLRLSTQNGKAKPSPFLHMAPPLKLSEVPLFLQTCLRCSVSPSRAFSQTFTVSVFGHLKPP